MKNTKFLITMTALAIAVMLSSCAKDGATGPAGANGNANVSVSVYSVAPSSWGSDGNGGWYCNLTPSFNPTQGAVNILGSTDDATWTGLPAVGYTIGAPDINFALNASTIQVFYDAQTGTASIAQPTVTFYFKVTLIPPAIMKQHPNTNWNDYNQVKTIIDAQNTSNK